MSLPNYSTWSDQELLNQATEDIKNTFTDTSGTDDERWREVLNTMLAGMRNGYPFRELTKRNRKWGQPNTNPPDPTQLPPSVPIVNPPDQLGIA